MLDNAVIKNIEYKIPDITNLATNFFLNTKINNVKGEIAIIINLATNVKINQVKGKIPNITNLITTALTAVENKIPNVSNLLKLTETSKFSKQK